MHWIRAWQARAAEGRDAGIGLVEMLVALTVASLMLSGVAYGLIRALWTTRDSNSREVAAQLRKMGLVGDNAMKIRSQMAVSDTESLSITRIENAGKRGESPEHHDRGHEHSLAGKRDELMAGDDRDHR